MLNYEFANQQVYSDIQLRLYMVNVR